MYLGEFRHSVDEKGRLFIPARFRKRENEKFFLTRGLEGCLFAFPENVWAERQSRVRELGIMKKDARAFGRLFFSGAAEVVCDRQGRINIPRNLFAHAGLEKEAVIIGVSDRFEVWSPENWAEYESSSTRRFEEIAESLVEE